MTDEPKGDDDSVRETPATEENGSWVTPELWAEFLEWRREQWPDVYGLPPVTTENGNKRGKG